jgi:hypothetical protein
MAPMLPLNPPVFFSVFTSSLWQGSSSIHLSFSTKYSLNYVQKLYVLVSASRSIARLFGLPSTRAPPGVSSLVHAAMMWSGTLEYPAGTCSCEKSAGYLVRVHFLQKNWSFVYQESHFLWCAVEQSSSGYRPWKGFPLLLARRRE